MADWILNFVKAGTPDKKQLAAQARHLFEIGLWGIPPGSPAAKNIQTGDRVIAYAGAPEKLFLADGVITQAHHDWTTEEVARYPLTSSFLAGLAIGQVSIWDRPLQLAAIWSGLSAGETNPTALFLQAAYRLSQADAEQLIATGRNGAQALPATPQPTSQPAPAQGAPAARLTPPTPAPVAPPAAPVQISPDAGAFLSVVSKIGDIPSGTKINEETTRALLLNKYFDLLGYSGLTDIQYGETAQSGNTPDYVLLVDGTPSIAVEAKALGTTLGNREAGQVTGYCGTLGVRWGLLTDGRIFKLYDAHVLNANLSDRLVFELDLTDYRSPEEFEISIWSTVQMLSKQNMQTGHDLERYATQEMARRLLTDPASPVTAALRSELARQKVTLTDGDVVALVSGLLSS